MPQYYIKKEEFKIVTLKEILPYIENAKGLGTKVLIALAFLTGARISELLKVKKKDIIIDAEKGEFRIRLISLKTYSSKRYVAAKETGEVLIPPMRELVFDIHDDPFIEDYVIPALESLKEESKLFSKSKRWYQYRLEELNQLFHGPVDEYGENPHYITFHYLRHSCITFITRELRANISDIKGWTGHRGSSYEVYIIPSAVDRFKGKMGKR